MPSRRAALAPVRRHLVPQELLERDLHPDAKRGRAVNGHAPLDHLRERAREGRFEIRFRADAFRDARESRPDLYLRVYDTEGIGLLHETTDAIRWNASADERYRLRIPAQALRR